MKNNITYVIDQNPRTEDDKIIHNGLINFNDEFIHEKPSHFSIFAKKENQILGGALISAHSDAFYLDMLWCDENHRNNGLGSKILEILESVAIKKQVSKIFVDTYDFQAQAFYQKNGFYLIGTIPDYLRGAAMVFLRKDIYYSLL